MNTTLIIMAAGIGSRFGGGIKQLEPVGPKGELIMDYSIQDALKAGFDNIIFIIRKDLEKDFREIIGERIERICPVSYAFQEIEDVPDGFFKASSRKKPWGTGQALLACKDLVKNPFVVINADDYYGNTAFEKVHEFLIKSQHKKSSLQLCLAGFILKNTLSDHGGVTRGICSTDGEYYLNEIKETRNIVKTSSGAAVLTEDGNLLPVDENAYVSMNMWGLVPEFLIELEKGFVDFLKNLDPEDHESEYILPMIIDQLIKNGRAEVKLLETTDKWFGVTYKEDKKTVTDAIRELMLK